MAVLAERGLDRFRQVASGSPRWRAYEAGRDGTDGETLTFLFRMENGRPRPSPVFQLIHHPAPVESVNGLASFH